MFPTNSMVPFERKGSLPEYQPGMWNSGDVDRIAATEGFVRRQKQSSQSHLDRVDSAQALLAGVIRGDVPRVFLEEAMNPSGNVHLLNAVLSDFPGLFPLRNGPYGQYYEGLNVREGMSYSDFSALTVDILDRSLVGYYTTAELVTRVLVKEHDLRDFRLRAIYAMDGGVKPFSKNAPGVSPDQRSMYQVARESTAPIPSPTDPATLGQPRVLYGPDLYDGYMAVNWRALLNDDLGIFADLTNRLMMSGIDNIASFITGLFWTTTGPNPLLFNSTFSNLVTTPYGAVQNNPPLGVAGLNDAITVLRLQRNSDGRPIQFTGKLYLVVPPALEVTANYIVKATTQSLSVLGGNQNPQGFPTALLNAPNLLSGKIDSVVTDLWMPIISNNNPNIQKSWMLVYDPNTQARPCVEMGFLTGYKTPQLYQKAPNTMRVGGGIDPSLGDFFSMDTIYKAMLVFGGAPIDGRSCVVSTGAGQ